MPKIKVEIEVPSDKYCDTIDNVCPMLQEGNWGKYYCCLFNVDLEMNKENDYSCIRCDKCKQAEVRMKEYKRLTERTKHGIAVLDSGERFVLSCGGYATTKALNRLAELEDKIEAGTIGKA